MDTVLRLLARLPWRALYGLSSVLARLAYHLDRRHRRIVFANLARAFPEYGPVELRRTARQFYRNLADVAVEVIKALAISEAELLARVRFVNPELLRRYTDRNQPLLLLASHQCNWEWLLLACSLQLPAGVAAIYKPLSVKRIDALMFELRSRFRAEPIAQDRAVVEIMRRRKTLPGVAIVADQTPHRQVTEKYWSHWFGHDTAFAVGPEKIAKLTGFAVLFVGMRRVRRGHYQVYFKAVAEPPYQDAAREVLEPYVRETERMIAAAPSDWLWSYKKWRYKKPLYA